MPKTSKLSFSAEHLKNYLSTKVEVAFLGHPVHSKKNMGVLDTMAREDSLIIQMGTILLLFFFYLLFIYYYIYYLLFIIFLLYLLFFIIYYYIYYFYIYYYYYYTILFVLLQSKYAR